MGAHSFGYYVKSDKSAREVYSDESSQATFERGHDGYNGTISTTCGVQEFTGGPLTEAEAAKRADQLIDTRKVEKWGYAGALAIYEPEAKHVRKVTRAIKLTGEQLRANHRNGSLWMTLNELMDSLVPEGVVREGERMTNYSIVNKPAARFGTEPDAAYKTRVITEATEGAKATRYFITGGQYEHRVRAWANGFASQAEARAALTEALKVGTPDSWGGEVEYGIVAESRREDGSPLVRSRREIISVTVKIEFTLVKKVVAPKRSGWYLFGIAAE